MNSSQLHFLCHDQALFIAIFHGSSCVPVSRYNYPYEVRFRIAHMFIQIENGNDLK